MLLGDLGINQPFSWGEQPWRVYTSVRGQWSPNALTPQERMAIAGRYTVRGFDGEQMLSGEKGLLWRNEIAWNVFSRGHELYLAADYGRVDGPNTRYLVGHQLAGSALGVRGALWGDSAMTCLPAFRCTSPQGSIPPVRPRVLA